MNIEQLRNFCLSLPHATEDIKWENDLCFSIGGKMFCISSMTEPLTVSFKAGDEDFEELTATNHILPAPYLARYKWVYVQSPLRFSKKEWEHYVRQSYEIIKAKLPKKVLRQL
ncbi:MAG: MmcQ/YjbR family DNA-binding protein [Chitinophagales bacterium]|nr:MmcQ/YjbR family DNA-binding protein [Chitinophagales bacterium]